MMFFSPDDKGTKSLVFWLTFNGLEAELIVRCAIPRGAIDPELEAEKVIRAAGWALCARAPSVLLDEREKVE